MDSPVPPSLNQDRLLIALAALGWSLSGLFTRLLTNDVAWWHPGPEPVGGLSIAFFRAFLAGMVLAPTLRWADLSFRPMMLIMVAVFALMNVTFVLAMAAGKSSNAILLQYTGPMWMYLASVLWLGEKADRRSLLALTVGLAGVGIILVGGWQTDESLVVILIALVSGLAYAGVVVCFRVLSDASSRWLVVLNQGCSALVLVPVLCWLAPTRPTWGQFGVLVLFGTVQTALPYWLMARGLRTVSPQEAGAITLLEPVLNPLWAFLVAPAKETPTWYTLAGGVCIVGGLAYRYGPWSRQRPPDPDL